MSGVIRVNSDLDLGKKNYYDLIVRATVSFEPELLHFILLLFRRNNIGCFNSC